MEHGGSVGSYRSILSQWTSRARVLKLVEAHERAMDTRFDIVILTRLDLCPCQSRLITFSELMLPESAVLRVGLMHKPSGLSQHARNFNDRFLNKQAHEGLVTAVWHPPRADDYVLVGTAQALGRLALGLVLHLPNSTASLGSCDPHGLLAVEMLRQFKREEMDVRDALKTAPKERSFYLPFNRFLVRKELAACAKPEFHQKPANCFDRYCTGRLATGSKAGMHTWDT